MGFPIKKRITCNRTEDEGLAPCGLDLLSAAIDSRLQHADPVTTCIPEGITVSASTSPSTSSVTAEDCPPSDNEDSCYVHPLAPAKAGPPIANSYSNSASTKQAKLFPEILLDILSNPDYAHIIGWLPHGRSFAIHDPSRFSSQILPKYFRRVIFRSFIRKLNRWGFRSVKRSVSGLESTFEHKDFSRDRPELCAKMNCKSNPSSKAALKGGAADTGGKPTISPSNSVERTESAAAAQASQASSIMSGNISRNEEFPVQFSNEMILREMQHIRQQALLQLIHQMPRVDENTAAIYVAEKLKLLMSQQQYNGL